MNIAEFLGTSFFIEHLQWLFLDHCSNKTNKIMNEALHNFFEVFARVNIILATTEFSSESPYL